MTMKTYSTQENLSTYKFRDRKTGLVIKVYAYNFYAAVRALKSYSFDSVQYIQKALRY